MRPEELRHIDSDLARRLHANHMELLGIENTMKLAHACNHQRFRRQHEWRREAYENDLDRLLDENGPPSGPEITLEDGWALDTSGTLPHLERVLDEAEQIIAERAGKRRKPSDYRAYFQDLCRPGDFERLPSLVDFATSSELLRAVSHYLGCIPALSATLPSGIRIVESNVRFDPEPETPKDSQLYHIDYYSLPNVYVLVLLRDTTIEHGPWTFIPKARSEEAKERLGYWGAGRDYRISDEEVYSVVPREEAIEFCHPRGSVLLIESSGCFHYGSRKSVNPRLLLMLAYTGACRTDFSEWFMEPRPYPVKDSDSRLRRMALDKDGLL